MANHTVKKHKLIYFLSVFVIIAAVVFFVFHPEEDNIDVAAPAVSSCVMAISDLPQGPISGPFDEKNDGSLNDYMESGADGNFIVTHTGEDFPWLIDPNKPMIAITCDDGPSSTLTPVLLDLAQKQRVHFTFFILGQRVAKNQALTGRIYAEGHEIGSHGFDHVGQFPKLGDAGLKKQLEWTAYQVSQATGGYMPTLVRPPYGAINAATAKKIGAPIILWSVDTLDWKYRDSKYVCDYIVNHASDGAIMLLHDIHKTSVEGICKAVPILKEKGYQFVTVSEMFKAKGLSLEKGSIYNKAIK